MPTFFDAEPFSPDIILSRRYELLSHRYELRWYEGWETWPPTGPATGLPAYVCMERPGAYSPVPPADEDEAFRWHIADQLWRTAEEESLPTCVVPDCTDKARVIFIAAERGRLAGRDWDFGDEIKVCPRHGSDIHRSQYARGMDQLAEWLRPDATWDWIDTLDGYEPLYGADLLARTARMLHLRHDRVSR